MKNIILWNHERGTWQYDVFCLLIIGFIFLTPKTWFEGKERNATPRPLSSVQVQDSDFNRKGFENQKIKLSKTENKAIYLRDNK